MPSAGVQAGALEDDGQERAAFKERGLREAEAVGIAKRPLDGPGEQELRHVDEHERDKNLVGVELVAKKRRDRAPESAAERRGQHDEDDEPGARRVVAHQGDRAARNGARNELALGADVPDVGAEAHHEAHGAEQQRRHLDAHLGPAAQAVERRDEEGDEGLDGILAERGEDHGARDDREQECKRGRQPAQAAGGLLTRGHGNGEIHASPPS